MRVVVTGGAGFVGSHLCKRLVAEGHDIVAIDNLITGDARNLASLEGDARLTLVTQDITTFIDVSGDVDLILHFASPASPPRYLALPIETLRVGALGTHNALGLARAKEARFLLASTSEVYGDPLVNPQPETYWGNVNPVGPRSVYNEAKRFAEAMTLAYHRTHGVDVKIARIFNTYGPFSDPDDGRAAPAFITAALKGEPLIIHGDGSQTRSLCYVDDLVDGILRLAASNKTGPMNIGNPREITMLELAKLIMDLTDSTSAIEFGARPVDDPSVRCPDITCAREALGWEPKISLEDGIRLTAAWFSEELAHERSAR